MAGLIKYVGWLSADSDYVCDDFSGLIAGLKVLKFIRKEYI